ncbi:MAG: hypothetical protein V4587_13975 [Acidobacteriota bacterium]
MKFGYVVGDSRCRVAYTQLTELFIVVGLIYPFLVLAVVGFVAALGVHLAALCGVTGPLQFSLKLIFPILFVVWVATILASQRLTREFKQKDLWRAALRGCPKLLQRALWILFGYAWIGSFTFHWLFGGGMDSPANAARSMSAILLAFYAIAACVLYSATQASKLDETSRCLNGHRISPLAMYCEKCGAPAKIQPTT